MAYFVLAGGFPSLSEKISGRKMDLDPSERVVDFIVKIDGLPKEFFIPVQIKQTKKYFCKVCKRDVSEAEIEGKYGCFQHALEVTTSEVEIWDGSIFESYEIKNMKYLTPMYRIWVNNPQGEEKWRTIDRYVKANYPAHKNIPEPIPVGNRMQWLAQAETIPCIDLEQSMDEMQVANMAIKGFKEGNIEDDKDRGKVTTNARGMYECHVCGKEMTSYRGLSSHIRAAHDGVMEKARERIKQAEANELLKKEQVDTTMQTETLGETV